MIQTNEQWFSLDGRLIDEKNVFNINAFSGTARYEKCYSCSYCHGSGRHHIRYANSTGACTACKGTGKQGSLIKECFTLAQLFKKNYPAAQKIVRSTLWRQYKMAHLTELEKKILLYCNTNPFLKSLALSIQSGRQLSIKQIAVAERILSEIH